MRFIPKMNRAEELLWLCRTKVAPRVIFSQHLLMTGQGTAGNVIAAVCSFFIPGLGQLIQGRLLMAIIHFVLAGVLWIILLGWLVHLWSIIDAAMFKPKG